MTMAIAKIKSSLGDSAIAGGEAVAVYEKLYEVGQRTGIAANDSAQGFTQLQLAMKDMNYGASDTIDLLEGLQSAGIIAGAKTQDVTEAVRQLGQAFGKGKLNGDELVTLSERMPRLLREVQKEMGMTTAQFFDASSKGKLTPEMLAPALLAASKRSIEELKKFPLTMARGYAIASNAASRFLAELDKQLGLSQSLGRAFVYIAQTLDSWRSGLSVIGDFVRALGGLEGMARLVGISLLVAFGYQILGSISKLITAINFIGAAFVRAFLPLTIFAIFVLAVEDFISWIEGKGSIFGDMFGDFETVIAPIKPQLEALKKWFEDNLSFSELWDNTKREINSLIEFFTSAWELIKNAVNLNVEGMKPQFEWLRGAAGFLMEAFRPLSDFFVGVFDTIIKIIDAFYNKVMVVVGGVRSAIQGVLGLMPGFMAATEGTGSGTDPEKQAEGRRNLRARGALGGFYAPETQEFLAGGSPIPDVTGKVGGGTNNSNSQQNNTITNDIIINAPAADPASIASGVNSGMGRATDSMTSRLGNSMALGLGISSPRIESPAMP